MLGLPIIGDKRYGHQVKIKIPDEIAAFGAAHHMLHARALQFCPAPNVEAVTVEATPPPMFESILRIVANH
jgi:23S rRNA-/tRNA-specific pseudouridylate synthase